MNNIKYLGIVILFAFILGGCTERSIRSESQERMYPEMIEAQTEVIFKLTLDGVSYPQDAAEIRTSSISAEALEQLPQMTGLQQVTVTEGGGENLEQLRTYCDENGIVFQVELAGQTVTEETAEITLAAATENQVQLLGLMPNLKSLHFPEPEAPAEALLELRTKLPETVVTSGCSGN